MNDFEALPVGTLKRIEDLEFELAIFRKAESEVTDAIADKAARGVLVCEKLLQACKQIVKDSEGQSFAGLVFQKSIKLAEDAIKQAEAL